MIFRIITSVFVILVLLLVAAIAEDYVAPQKPVRSAPSKSNSDDSDMKGMKIN